MQLVSTHPFLFHFLVSTFFSDFFRFFGFFLVFGCQFRFYPVFVQSVLTTFY